MSLQKAYAVELYVDFKQSCAEHGRRCFIAQCSNRVAFTKSWLSGETLHACAVHETLLPAKRPEAQRQLGLAL